jgi:hypothetical protein
MFKNIWDWLGNFNNATSILLLCGVPMTGITTGVAGIIGHVEKLRISYIVVLLLAVFGLTLWSWIGLIWLFDRAKKPKPLEKPTLDCAWGIAIDAAFLTFDGISPIACQISVQLRNLHPWPLRCHVIRHLSDVDGVVPNMKVGGLTSIVIMPDTPVTIGFDGYSQGTIAQKTSYKGKIEISINYGHPDIGMTREMTRFYNFDLQLHPNPFQMLRPQPAGSTLPQLAGRFLLPLSHSKDEEDKPLLSKGA